jgi:hypothetical protein
MRNLLALIGLAVVGFAGVGWYQGWYVFALQPGANGKQRIQLDVDTHKIAEDAKKLGETVGKTVEAVREKADQPKTGPAEFVGPPVPAGLQPKPPAPDRAGRSAGRPARFRCPHCPGDRSPSAPPAPSTPGGALPITSAAAPLRPISNSLRRNYMDSGPSHG